MDRKNLSSRIGKYIRRVMGILAAFAVFAGGVHVLDYLYLAPQDQEWERILWHHFYEDKGRIDNLYIGSSHVYLGIDPQMLDVLNGQYNFNLASTAQPINGTYYLLREAERNNELKHVYVDLFYYEMVKNNFDSDSETIDTEIHRNWQNTDYMKWSFNKLAYMLSIAGPDKYVDICLPFSRYRKYVNNTYFIHINGERKSEEEYLAFAYHQDFDDGNGYDEYLRQGYYKSTREFLEIQRLYPQYRILNENPMGAKSEKYLRKIIDYCQKRNIPVTFFVTPIDDLQLISTENYDNYIEQVSRIVEEYNVPFYDFNLAREEYLPIRSGKYFRDVGHLNHAGAQIFTPFFYEVVSGDISENEKYFYDSYREKLEVTESEMYGLYYRDSEETDGSSEQMRTICIASNRDDGMEYRVIMTPNEGEEYMIQDFDNHKEFTISKEEHGICTIIMRIEGTTVELQTIETGY